MGAFAKECELADDALVKAIAGLGNGAKTPRRECKHKLGEPPDAMTSDRKETRDARAVFEFPVQRDAMQRAGVLGDPTAAGDLRALDLALAPDSAFVRWPWGCHLAMRGLLDNAEAELLLARRLDPQYVNTRTQMIKLRIAQGRLPEAAAEWAELADLLPGSLSVEGLGAMLAAERGDPAADVGHCRRACELMPENPACQAHLAGALAQAQTLLADQPLHFAGRVKSPCVMAIVALRMGDAEQSLTLLRGGAQKDVAQRASFHAAATADTGVLGATDGSGGVERTGETDVATRQQRQRVHAAGGGHGPGSHLDGVEIENRRPRVEGIGLRLVPAGGQQVG